MIQKIQFTIFFFRFTLAAELTKQFYIRNSCLIFTYITSTSLSDSVRSQIERPDYSGLLGQQQTDTPYCHCGVISSGLYRKTIACLETCTNWTKPRAHFLSVPHLDFGFCSEDSHTTREQAAVCLLFFSQ